VTAGGVIWLINIFENPVPWGPLDLSDALDDEPEDESVIDLPPASRRGQRWRR
jgi:hypothetical protein